MKRILTALLAILSLWATPSQGQSSKVGRTTEGTLAARPNCPGPAAAGDIYVANDQNPVQAFICSTGGWGSLGGGANPTGNNGDLQSKNGSNLAASHVNDNGTVIDHTEDVQFIGPNPYIDVRDYHVRATTGAAPSTTATMSSGSAVATLALASNFQNNDGVLVRSAGPTPTMATPAAPTIQTMGAGNMTGIGSTITNTLGAASCQYQVAAVDILRGVTIASTAATSTTCPNTFGINVVNVASWTRSNNTVTVTTASAHNLVAGMGVLIQVDGGISGSYIVATVPDNTHFTYSMLLDTRLGAAASGGSTGTVTYALGVKITIPSITGAQMYLVYGRTAGSMNLVCATLPDNGSNTDPLYNTCEDYGSTYSVAPTLGDWAPTTPPVAVKNDDLSTTIVSGAGTTSVTLAATASNNVTAQNFFFDNVPNIIAAKNAAVTAGFTQAVMRFPVVINGGGYVTKAVLQLNTFPKTLSVEVGSSIGNGDTIYIGNTKLIGINLPTATSGSFAFEGYPSIGSSTAYPVIYEASSVSVSNLTISNNTANATVWAGSGASAIIPASTYKNLNIGVTTSSDCMGRAYVMRNNISGSGNYIWDRVTFNVGTCSVQSLTPNFIHTLNGGSPFNFSNIFINRRGMYFGGGFEGNFNGLYCQGCTHPDITVASSSGVQSIQMNLSNVIQDTTFSPVVAFYGNLQGTINLTNGGNPGGGFPIVTGPAGLVIVNQQAIAVANLANFNQQTGSLAWQVGTQVDGVNGLQPVALPQVHQSLSTVYGNSNQVAVEAPPMAAPVVTLLAGGSQSPGTSPSFQIMPVFGTNGEGAVASPASNTVTFPGTCPGSGTCQAQITWTAVNNASGYDLYRTGFSVLGNSPMVAGGGTTTFTWNGQLNGASLPPMAGSGVTAMDKNGFYGNSLNLQPTTGSGLGTFSMSASTAPRTYNAPDASGNVGLTSGGMTQPFHLVNTRTDGTIADMGVAPMNVFDSGNRNNGTAISGNSNWVSHAVFSGVVNIASGSFVGGGNGTNNYIVYTGASFPTDDQTVAATITGVGSNANIGADLGLFFSPTVATGYLCGYSPQGTPSVSLSKEVSGTFTSLGTASYTASVGDRLSCNVSKGVLNLYVNGVLKVGPISDSTITSGFPALGFFSNNASLTMNNFTASFGAVSLNLSQNWAATQSFLNPIQIGSSPPACTPGTGGGECLAEGTSPTAGANYDTLYANSSDHMLHENLNNGGDLPVPNRQMLTSTYTNATTTASNITGLSFTAAASSNYTLTCYLYYQGSASTAGLDITITGPASPTSLFYSYTENPTATSVQTSVASAFATKLTGNAAVTATTNLPAVVTVGLRNGANAGTVQVQGSATGAGTVTIQAGSYCTVQ